MKRLLCGFEDVWWKDEVLDQCGIARSGAFGGTKLRGLWSFMPHLVDRTQHNDAYENKRTLAHIDSLCQALQHFFEH